MACIYDLTPAAAVGTLANFTTRAVSPALDRALSLPTVECIAPAPSLSDTNCTATRSQLEEDLYAIWFKANITDPLRTSSSYEGGGTAFTSFSPGKVGEGAYQCAYNWNAFELDSTGAPADFSPRIDLEVMYNGSVTRGFNPPREPEAPACYDRAISAIFSRLRALYRRHF
mgnify:CR=1 FL=1